MSAESLSAEEASSSSAVLRYWCHKCRLELSLAQNVELQCPHCHEYFIEEIEGHERPEFERDDEEVDEDLDQDDIDEDVDVDSMHPEDMLNSVMDNPNGQNDLAVQVGQLLQSFIGGLGGPSAATAHSPNSSNRAHMRLRGFPPFQQTRSSGGASAPPTLVGLMQHLLEPFEGLLRGSVEPGRLGDYYFGPQLDAVISHLMEHDPNRWGPPPASKDAVKALPIHTINQEDVDKHIECPVCMEQFALDTDTKKLPCDHLFHPDCILPWLAEHNSCPVCRFGLPTEDDT